MLSVAIVLLLFGLVKAQPGDPLEQARQTAKLNAQKLKAELTANFQDAARLERSNPERARELLRKNRLLLEDDAITLSERERKSYLEEVEVKLFRMNDRAKSQKKSEEVAILQAAEVRAFREKLKADADRAQRLGNPSMSGQLAFAQKQYKDQILAQNAQREKMLRDLQAAQQPGTPFYSPPKTDKSAPPAKDILLMKALNSTMKISIKNIPMKLVLEDLEDKTKGALTIIIDDLGIKQAMVEPELFKNDPVNKEFRQPMKVRVFLKMILEERGMGYYIEDGALYVTKDAKALTKMVVKTYPVSNLVGGQQLVTAAIQELQYSNRGPTNPANPMPQAPQLGPSGQLLSQNIDGLTAQIMGTIEPDYWKAPVGTGPGSMAFVPTSASLQVRASLEIQYLLMASGLLDNKK